MENFIMLIFCTCISLVISYIIFGIFYIIKNFIWDRKGNNK